jgi:N-(2-amino-2-carboxyethyl)-L-glutamate synthase
VRVDVNKTDSALDLKVKRPPSLGSSPACPQIGNTSIAHIELQINGQWRDVWLKLEGENPGGSIKDRTAEALMDSLDRDGRLKPDSVVVESTSGNLGAALAMIARARAIRFMAIVDVTISDETLARIQDQEADVEIVRHPDSTGGFLLSRLERVREICASSHRYVWTNQYENMANPLAHFTTTAPELYSQMDHDVDAIFIAVSTGGTLAGIGRYFRQVSPRTKIIAVDAVGSVALGGPPGKRLVRGIGSSKASGFVTDDLYDRSYLISDAQAFATCKALKGSLGISVGGSGGAVLYACATYLTAHPERRRVLCLCADTGENYRSSLFNDSWLESLGINLTKNDLLPIAAFRPSSLL